MIHTPSSFIKHSHIWSLIYTRLTCKTRLKVINNSIYIHTNNDNKYQYKHHLHIISSFFFSNIFLEKRKKENSYFNDRHMWEFLNKNESKHYQGAANRCSVKKGIHKKFAKLSEKLLCWSHFLIKLCHKMWLQHKCFSVNFANLLRTPVLKYICELLILFIKTETLRNYFLKPHYWI